MWGRARHDPPLPTPSDTTPGLLEAQRAQREAREALEETIHRGPEVRGVMGRVFAHGQTNHWNQVINDIWSGGS